MVDPGATIRRIRRYFVRGEVVSAAAATAAAMGEPVLVHQLELMRAQITTDTREPELHRRVGGLEHP